MKTPEQLRAKYETALYFIAFDYWNSMRSINKARSAARHLNITACSPFKLARQIMQDDHPELNVTEDLDYKIISFSKVS